MKNLKLKLSITIITAELFCFPDPAAKWSPFKAGPEEMNLVSKLQLITRQIIFN